MERAEILKRVIAILTEVQEIRHAVEAGEDPEIPEAESQVVTELLNEMLPSVRVPADAAPKEVVRLVAVSLGPALQSMVAGFSLAFTSLAMAHDNGRTDLTSADVLRTLALEVERGTYDDGAS
ncbi:hypothetical protein [Streptomyces globosus]|uniref:hypothetical protein n=1 Tax=Streptomyces globosus TaxID=68209 RepID=UPI0031E081AC